MNSGTEIRLFDPHRDPRDWTDLMPPTSCAVFLKDRTTAASLDSNGQVFHKSLDVSCFVFDRLEDAQCFCDARVRAFPHLRCEIYDSQGLAHPPLLVILHPDHQLGEDSGSGWSRRRKLVAVGFLVLSAPLFWYGTRQFNSSDVALFLGINCALAALRFVYWDFGLKHRQRENRKRLESHRRMERGDA